MSNQIEIYTDGSARGNPGNGGYGIVLKYKGYRKEMNAGFRLTTNNRMELLALIVALEELKSNEFPVHVYSDSKYVIDSIQKRWVYNWVKIDFKGKKNKDLWLRFLAIESRFNIILHWVKGHNGHQENERCDQLAVEAALGNNLLIDEVFEQESKNQNSMF